MWEIMCYGEVPYKMIATQDIQEQVRAGTRLSLPEGLVVDVQYIVIISFMY